VPHFRSSSLFAYFSRFVKGWVGMLIWDFSSFGKSLLNLNGNVKRNYRGLMIGIDYDLKGCMWEQKYKNNITESTSRFFKVLAIKKPI
jgi:hypothetical protein